MVILPPLLITFITRVLCWDCFRLHFSLIFSSWNFLAPPFLPCRKCNTSLCLTVSSLSLNIPFLRLFHRHLFGSQVHRLSDRFVHQGLSATPNPHPTPQQSSGFVVSDINQQESCLLAPAGRLHWAPPSFPAPAAAAASAPPLSGSPGPFGYQRKNEEIVIEILTVFDI